MSTLKKEIVIRVAALDDAEELLEIYAPYVRETAITFEYEVPTIEEFAVRIAHTLERYPYLVAKYNGEIVGYGNHADLIQTCPVYLEIAESQLTKEELAKWTK